MRVALPFVLLLSSLLAGCAATETREEALRTAMAFEPVDGQAVVYFLRDTNNLRLATIQFTLRLPSQDPTSGAFGDVVTFINIDALSFGRLIVDPGRFDVELVNTATPLQPLALAPGAVRCFRISWDRHPFGGATGFLDEISPDKAAELIQTRNLTLMR